MQQLKKYEIKKIHNLKFPENNQQLLNISKDFILF